MYSKTFLELSSKTKRSLFFKKTKLSIMPPIFLRVTDK